MIGNRVATYARFSSNLQREESIDAQERAMKKFCEDNGYIIVATYRDEAKSATSDNRPQFLQAIADSEKNMFDILLVHKLDRFSRNRYDSAIYRSKLKKNGVKVYSVLERLDDSPESIILEALLEGMSEYYSRNLSREVSKGLLENFYAGKFTGGITPYGFSVDENMKYIINEDEAPAIRMAFSMFARGNGYTEILKTLDAAGYRCRKGMPFTKSWLNSILRNEKYKGVYVFRKQNPRKYSLNYGTKTEILRLPNGCPAIVSEELFDKVQRQMKVNRYYNLRCSEDNNGDVTYLLRGVTFCGECGKRMIVNSRPAGRKRGLFYTYRCFTPKHVCNNREFNKKYLEDYVVMLLEKHLFNQKTMKEAVSAVRASMARTMQHTEQEISELTTQMTMISQTIENITAMLAQSGYTEAMMTRIADLEIEKQRIENEVRQRGALLAKLHCDVDGDDLLAYYKEAKNSSSGDEFRAVVMEYVKSVTVYRHQVVIRVRTGLGMVDDLDMVFDLTRAEIYEYFGSRVRTA